MNNFKLIIPVVFPFVILACSTSSDHGADGPKLLESLDNILFSEDDDRPDGWFGSGTAEVNGYVGTCAVRNNPTDVCMDLYSKGIDFVELLEVSYTHVDGVGFQSDSNKLFSIDFVRKSMKQDGIELLEENNDFCDAYLYSPLEGLNNGYRYGDSWGDRNEDDGNIWFLLDSVSSSLCYVMLGESESNAEGWMFQDRWHLETEEYNRIKEVFVNRFSSEAEMIEPDTMH